jgi:hypothetical protein
MQIRWRQQEFDPAKDNERTAWARRLIDEAGGAVRKVDIDAVLMVQSGSSIVVVLLGEDGVYEVIDAVVVRRADVDVT